jgi:hypothetical protein
MAAGTTTGLPDEDLPALCVAIDRCCREDRSSRACAESPDLLAEHGISRWTCGTSARAWEAEHRAGENDAPPPGCGPLLALLDADARLPLAEDEVRCRADEECVVLAAGREEWCNVGGVVVAAVHGAAAEVQARLDAMPLPSTDAMALVCPLALARCVRGACEPDWEWARCERDDECVRVEQGATADRLANACRADSADRLARAIEPRGAPRVSRERVSCYRARCTLDEDARD